MANNCCDECDELGAPIGATGPAGSIIGAVAKITIPSASVLTLFSTPYTLLPAPGAGKAIRLVDWSASITYNSIAYATNTTLQIYTATAGTVQGSNSVILTSTASRHLLGSLTSASGTTSTQLIANQALLLNTLSGNPTAGNSVLTIYIGYDIITL